MFQVEHLRRVRPISLVFVAETNPTATLQRPYSDPTATLQRPYNDPTDPTETLQDPTSDPTGTLHCTSGERQQG